MRLDALTDTDDAVAEGLLQIGKGRRLANGVRDYDIGSGGMVGVGDVVGAGYRERKSR